MDGVLNILDFFKQALDAQPALVDALDEVAITQWKYLSSTTLIIKSGSLLMIFLNLFNKLKDSTWKGDDKLNIDLKDIKNVLLAAFLIGFYEDLFKVIEDSMIALSALLTIQDTSKDMFMDSLKYLAPLIAQEYAAKLTNFVSEGVAKTFAPSPWIVGGVIINTILLGINYLTFILLYVERSLILLLYHFLAPLIFVLSLFEGYKNKVNQFFISFITFMLMLPMICFVYMCIDAIYAKINDPMALFFGAKQAENLSMNLTTENVAGFLTSIADDALKISGIAVFWTMPLALGCIFLKMRMYNRAFQIIGEIVKG